MKKLLVIVFLGGFLGFAFITWQQKKWDTATRFTLISLDRPIVIKSFDPSTGDGITLVLPDNLMLDTVAGKGGWRTGVIEKLGEKWGSEWVSDSIADYLGITYTGITEDLNLADRILWWWYGREIKWEPIVLAETSLLSEVKDPDGVVLVRLGEHWPEKAEAWFSSANLAREQVNVNVVNTTGVGGLGAHVARIVENGGIRVISVGNSNTQGDLGKCLIEGDETLKNSLTGKWLMKQFGCLWQIKSENQKEIKLIVGSEYKKWWLGE